MKLQISSALFILAATMPAFAALNCGTYQVVGTQCATNIILGWGTAGVGTDSLITFFVPPTVSAPVTFQFTQLNSSAGASYAGFFGAYGAFLGSAPKVQTVATAQPFTGGPGTGGILHITNVCFDPTCTAAPPAGIVPDMFSAQFQVLASSAADLNMLVPPLLTIRFLDGNGIVTNEEQETALGANPTATEFVIDGVAEGATAADRYVYSGSAVTEPFVAFSITNPSPTQSITGRLILYGVDGSIVASTTLSASIPPLGAAGYLLIGRFPGDTLGLFPSTTVLPDPTNIGVSFGALGAAFTAPAIFLAQQYNGNAMLNMVVF